MLRKCCGLKRYDPFTVEFLLFLSVVPSCCPFTATIRCAILIPRFVARPAHRIGTPVGVTNVANRATNRDEPVPIDGTPRQILCASTRVADAKQRSTT